MVKEELEYHSGQTQNRTSQITFIQLDGFDSGFPVLLLQKPGTTTGPLSRARTKHKKV